MSRPGLTDQTAAAAASPHVAWFPLVQMDLDSGTLYLTGTPFDVDYNGITWTSLRGLGSLEKITETADEIAGLRFTLSGIPAAVVAEVQLERYQGRPCTVLWAFMAGQQDAPTLSALFTQAQPVPPTLSLHIAEQVNLLGDYVADVPGTYHVDTYVPADTLLVDPAAWQGRLDVATLQRSADTRTLTITAEHKLADWERPRKFYFNHADQQRLAPGDNFYLGIEAMTELTIVVFSKEVMAI